MLSYAIRSAITLGSSPQSFLGARWIPAAISLSPKSLRPRLARRILSLSPHYYFGPNGETWLTPEQVAQEDVRNRESRKQIIKDLVAPYLRPEHTVIDYGCGPGYLAIEAAKLCKQVIACDIAKGVLACAQAINSADNITYVDANDPNWSDGLQADVAYSFAVAQHVRDSVLSGILQKLHSSMRPGALLLMHVVIDAEGWRTEAEWTGDTSMQGKMKLKLGLNCFTRSTEQVTSLLHQAGFRSYDLRRVAEMTSVDDDIRDHHLLICSRC